MSENEQKKKKRGGRGVGVGERENQKKKKMRKNMRISAQKGKCVRGKVKRVLLNKSFFL